MKKKATKKTQKLKRQKITFENIGEKLNIKQELFCRLFTHNDFLFGNATLAYASAYGYHLETLNREPKYGPPNKKGIKNIIEDSPYDKAYNVCSVQSHHLLRNPKINERVIELLNELANDKQIDAEIMRTVKQNEDYGAKIRAIDTFNKLRNRITTKIDLSTLGKEIQPITGMRIVVEEVVPTQNGD